MSSSPPSAARNEMPAVYCKACFSVSRLRSSISFSVITVTDCGMSRRSWVPRATPVRVTRRLSRPSSGSAFSRTVTVDRVLPSTAGASCANAPSEPESSIAPSGISVWDAMEGVAPGDRLALGWGRFEREFRAFDMVAGWRFDTSAGYNHDRPLPRLRSLAGGWMNCTRMRTIRNTIRTMDQPPERAGGAGNLSPGACRARNSREKSTIPSSNGHR